MTAHARIHIDPIPEAMLTLLDRVQAMEGQIAALQAERNLLRLRLDALEWAARTNRKAGR
jgi:hypothetical protein